MAAVSIQPLTHIPDWEERLARQDAFWDRGRPVVSVVVRRRGLIPEEHAHATLRDRWLDAGFQARRAAQAVASTHYLGDALPVAWPNLGPDILAAMLGCPLVFGEETTWSEPVLQDWADAGALVVQADGPYGNALSDLTDALLEAGDGLFYTGLTDFHPGGDLLAALRDPQTLAMDLVDHPAEVKALLPRLQAVYFGVYDDIRDRLARVGQPCTTWLGIVSSRNWYVPSNDFSCMVSEAMFEDVFLPGIVEECRHVDASIYHLDGPGALRHLDALLAIDELNAVQWVWGAGHGRATDWLPVYRRIQAAGKGIHAGIEPDELEAFIGALRPEGVWLEIHSVGTVEEGDALVRRVRRW